MIRVDESLIRYATGWNEAVLPRLGFAVFGLAILALTLRVAWKRDCSVLNGLLWLLIGSVFVGFSAFPQWIIDAVTRTDYLMRVRVIASFISVLVLLITFESLRRTRLQERYAILWVATSMVIFLCAALPRVVNLFMAVTGMQYAGAVVAVAFTFLVLVAFHFSISMSSVESDQSRIAQRVAILEARIKHLEEASARKDGPAA
jgi:hypothetical protein